MKGRRSKQNLPASTDDDSGSDDKESGDSHQEGSEYDPSEVDKKRSRREKQDIHSDTDDSDPPATQRLRKKKKVDSDTDSDSGAGPTKGAPPPDMRKVSQPHDKNKPKTAPPVKAPRRKLNGARGRQNLESSDNDDEVRVPKTKKKRAVDKAPLDQAIDSLASGKAAADLHAAFEAQSPIHLRSKIRKMPKNAFMKAAARKATAGSGLTPVQAGVYAFYLEYLKTAVHTISPQEPPVPPMIYPGRGDVDASSHLTKRFPALAEANKTAGGKNVGFFGPIVSPTTPPATAPSLQRHICCRPVLPKICNCEVKKKI